MRSLEHRDAPFDWSGDPAQIDVSALLGRWRGPTTDGCDSCKGALWAGASLDEVHRATAIDPWFLSQIGLLNEPRMRWPRRPELTPELLRLTKRHGFSDAQLGALRRLPEPVVRGVRQALGIRPVYKTVDTCAAEFEARTPYHYSSYDDETEVARRERPAVIILGSGPKSDRPGHRVRLLLHTPP